MGRGRAKAKQQKVARDLKYNNQPTDFDALQRELAGSGGPGPSSRPRDTAGEEAEDDEWTGTDH